MPNAVGIIADSYTKPAAGGGLPVAGAVGWWDASDAASITASAGKVFQWSNKAGALHWTQATSVQQPSTGVNTMNGKNVLTFSVDPCLMNISANPCLGAAGGTLFWVAKNNVPNSTASPAVISGLGGPGGPATCDDFHTYSNGQTYHRFGSTERPLMSTPATLDVPRVVCLRSAPSDWKWWMDGVQQYSGTTNTVQFSPDASYIWLGRNAQPTQFAGQIAEIVLYNRALTDPERQSVENYLATKWIPWTPTALTGLLGWWDANDASTFSYYSTNQISQWNDKSGNGKHAKVISAAPGSWYATKVPTGINGKPGIDFHPGTLETTIDTNIKPFTVIIALKTGTATDAQGVFGRSYDNGAGGNGWMKWHTTSGMYQIQAHFVQTIGTAATTFPTNTPGVYSFSYGSDNVWAHHRNGVVDGTGTTAASITPGNCLAFGATTAPNTGNFDGLIGEVIIYNRVLTTPERQQVESYLSAKWIPPPFNPLSINWHSAFWASDPSWTPPANGGLVNTWRNAGTCAVNGTGIGGFQPTYQSAYANLNNKPVVYFNGANLVQAATPSIAQPNHIFMVSCRESGSGSVIYDGEANTNHRFYNHGTGSDIWLYAGDYRVASGAGIDGPLCSVALFDSAVSTLRTNGVTRTVTGTASTQPFAGLRLGYDSSASNPCKGAIAFIGIKDSALTAQEISDLEAWSKSFYGTP